MTEKSKTTHNMQQDPTALQIQLETDKLANQLRQKLGLEPVQTRDENGNTQIEWEETEFNTLNREGIEKVVGLVRAIVDKNQTTSIYTDKEIRQIMKGLHEKVARELVEEWDNYGIERRGQADKVIEIVTTNCYSALKRAKDGRTLDSVTKTAETKTNVSTGEKEKEGFGWF